MTAVNERNFRLNVAEGVSCQAGMTFMSQTAILPLFVAHYTDAKWALGSLSAIFALGALAQIFGACAIATQRSFWPAMQLQTLLPRLALLALAVAPWLPDSLALGGFFILLLVFTLTMGFNGPSWLEFVSHVIPAGRRGEFFGLRNALGGLFSLGAMGLASWLLGSLPVRLSFGLCFLMAAGLWLISFHCIRSTRHDWDALDRSTQSASHFFRSAFTLLKTESNFMRYLGCRVLLTGSIMASAFYVIFGLSAYHLTVAQGSLLAIAFTLLPCLAGVAWGRLFDKWGNKRLQVPAALLAGGANLMLAAFHSLPLFVFCLFLIGCANVIMTIGDSKWLLELGGKRCGAVMSFFNLALVPSSVLLSLLGGLLAQRWGLAPVFTLTGLAWLGGGTLLSAIVMEPHARSAVTRAAA